MATFSVSDSVRVTQILASLVTHGLSEDDQKQFFSDLRHRKGEMDVTVRINGFDVDSTKFFGSIEGEFDEHVRKAARKLLEDQMWDLKEHMTNSMMDFLDKKFLKEDPDES